MGIKRAPLLLFILMMINGYSQMKPDSAGGRALNIYLDCAYCDLDFLRAEIPIVNYVRDRYEADVDIVASTIPTGSGGNKLTFVFIGQGKFKGQQDTIRVNTTSFETDDGTRKKVAKAFKLGLARYIAQTSYIDKLDIAYIPDTTSNKKTDSLKQPVDKWKAWVFTAMVGGNVNQQQLTQQVQLSPTFIISKVTPEWKVNLNASSYYQDFKYNIDGQILDAVMRIENFNGVYVKSLGEHFSTGAEAGVNTSTVSNFLLQAKTGPAIEYSLFPYGECTHRQIRLLYAIYDVYNHYVDTTVLGKIQQNLAAESLTLYSQYKEKWGSLSAQVTGAHYLYDPTKYEVNMNLSLTCNLFEGFSMSVNGYANIVHDQIYLPAAGPTETDILLGLQALPTTYQFGVGIMFTYTFGSIYNNLVNQRFNLLFPYF